MQRASGSMTAKILPRTTSVAGGWAWSYGRKLPTDPGDTRSIPGDPFGIT